MAGEEFHGRRGKRASASIVPENPLEHLQKLGESLKHITHARSGPNHVTEQKGVFADSALMCMPLIV